MNIWKQVTPGRQAGALGWVNYWKWDILVEPVKQRLALPDNTSRARLLLLCSGECEAIIHVTFHQHDCLQHSSLGQKVFSSLLDVTKLSKVSSSCFSDVRISTVMADRKKHNCRPRCTHNCPCYIHIWEIQMRKAVMCVCVCVCVCVLSLIHISEPTRR